MKIKVKFYYSLSYLFCHNRKLFTFQYNHFFVTFLLTHSKWNVVVLFFCERFLEVPDGLHSGTSYFRLSSLVLLVLHQPQSVDVGVGTFCHLHHHVSSQTVLQMFSSPEMNPRDSNSLRLLWLSSSTQVSLSYGLNQLLQTWMLSLLRRMKGK